MVVGVKTPFIMRGDNLVKITVDSVLATLGKENIDDGDIIAVTEAVVAIAQNNILTKKAVAAAIKKLIGPAETLVILWPIFSRNRFAPILDCLALAMQGKKIIIQLNAFIDEQGNNLFNRELSLKLEQKGLTESQVRQEFGTPNHVITGVDYLDLYRKIGEKRGAQVEIVCSNAVDYIQDNQAAFVVSCVHGRDKTKKLLQKKGYLQVYTLQDICTRYCEYGLLGANALNENELKLFPGQAQKFVQQLVAEMKKRTGKTVECLVYGDGAFKDPFSGIWELADPVCAPGFTEKLASSPQEIKLKAVLNDQLQGETDQKALVKEIAKLKKTVRRNQGLRFGTTPRRYHDLLASLADLVSGSGDKGTPVIYIKNYFGV